MAIQTNLKDRTPARDRLKKEITLLSHGYSMPDKIPDGKIMVFPWDHTVDEWATKRLKTIDDKNLIVYELVKKVTALKDISDMPVGDVITILLVSRALARESTIEYLARCPDPDCGHTEPTTIQVPDQLEKMAEKKSDYAGFEEVALPISKDFVALRPLQVKDEIRVSEQREMDKQTARMICSLVSVNTGKPDSLAEAKEYLLALTPADYKFVGNSIESISPRLSSDINHVCSKCGKKYVHTISFDSDFFR